MSEKSHHPEHHRVQHNAESHKSHEHLKSQPESAHSRHEHQDNIGDIQRSIDRHAKKAGEVHVHSGPESSHGPSEAYINKELKLMAFTRTMHRVRRSLSPTDKTFSRIIHNPTIDKLSETASKTVARPSAMLGAGIVSAIGGVIYFMITRHYGYDYNATVLLVLFIGGFAVGLLIELVRKLSRRA